MSVLARCAVAMAGILALTGAGLPAAATADAAGVAVGRVSVTTGGAQVGGGSTPGNAVSADGRYVVFVSSATNLVGNDTNRAWDVFLRDRVAGRTTRVSVSSAGREANGPSGNPAISADGRYVAFGSEASNLVPGDTNGQRDVFVRDRATGTTRRINVTTGGGQANLGSWGELSLSADGRYVAFTSGASNLVPGDTNICGDVFVRDRVAGTTTRVSVATGGGQGDDIFGFSFWPSISADGRYVAFGSYAHTLVPGDTNRAYDVFVRDRMAGTTDRISVSTGGAQGDGGSQYPSISADGRYVAFESDAGNLVPGDGNHATDVLVRDRVAGTTERVSVSSAGTQANSVNWYPRISADGRYVAFDSRATNLVPWDTNRTDDVYVRDRVAGSTRIVSLTTRGALGNGPSQEPAISGNGLFVVYLSYASNLVPGDTNRVWDTFIRRI